MTKHPIINKIHSPKDYRALSKEDIETLPAEIRSFLVERVSENGGHLASNLGIVELTMALHSAFDPAEDRLIFDVGHQAYVHKILSGRAAEFGNLRKKGGLTGFPKRNESACDAFDTGHASTSISAAIGILRADVLLGKKRSVVAVVGDGALSGGMCFEALNDAGQSGLPLVVVVNDNAMSISRNVGAMSRHLYKLRSSTSYLRFKSRFESVLRRIPLIGNWFANALQLVKNKIKYLVIPNVLFEELGFTYLGPIDGHDYNDLCSVLNRAKKLNAPVVVHALTTKGKGYIFAECNPEQFHGIGSFDSKTGKINKKSGGTSNSNVFGSELCAIAAQDPHIAAICAAMPSGTGLTEFSLKYPGRFFDVGIAEEHAVTMAAGMASAGIKPVVAIYSTFLQRAYDQIIHDVCLQGLGVVFAIDRAGLVGEDGETHQGLYDIAFMLQMPGMCIMSPSTVEELKEMLKISVSMDSPCALRYNRGSLPTRETESIVEFGKWEECRPVSKITIIATGRLVERALEATQKRNIGVVNARFLKPMDDEMLNRIAQTCRYVITMEDGIKQCAFGSSVAEKLEHSVEKVIVLGAPDRPIPQATVEQQDEICGLDLDSLLKQIDTFSEEARI